MLLVVKILVGWALVLALLAIFTVSTGGKFFNTGIIARLCQSWWRKIGRIAEHPRVIMFAIALLAIAMRLIALPVLPEPNPRYHDEFCYLLAADTFASGRITNPQHQLWQFFEAQQLLVRPTYMSKYPPAQSIVIALGFLLSNSWFFGVLLSFGIMCAAIFWMARGFMPVRWALMAALMPIIHPGIGSYWSNSYWGGCVAAIGGALVFGAYARLSRNPSTAIAVVFAFGLLILANSRPFEGFVAALPTSVMLIYSLVTKKLLPLGALCRRFILPASILAAGSAGMLYYNYCITGSALQLPYFECQRQYAMVPMLNRQSLNPEPVYNNPQLRDFWVDCNMKDFNRLQTTSGWLNEVFNHRLPEAFNFFVGIWFAPLAGAAFLSLKDGRARVLWVSIAAVSLAIAAETYFYCHYMAPITAPLYALLVQGFRHLRQIKLRKVAVGLASSRLIIAASLAYFLVGLLLLPVARQLSDERTLNLWRAKIMTQLAALPGNHLVIVHYAQGHNPRAEYVYNRADIDKSKVVWARDLGEEKNKKLLAYYNGRQVWLLDADSSPEPRLYSLKESEAATLTQNVNDYWRDDEDFTATP